MLRPVYVFLAAGLLIHSTASGQGVSVLPAPQVLTINGAPVALPREDQAVSVQYRPAALVGSRPVALGVKLLASRLEFLGAELVTESAPPDASVVAVVQASGKDLLDALRALGLTEELDEGRLAQAYVLSCSRQPGKPLITLSARSPLGAHYGLLTLCQLLDTDEGGHISMPCVQIADWPGIGLRLSKTSASENPLRMVRAFAAWNGLMKMNMLGLQYHGKTSTVPEQVFMHNVEALCGEARRDQLMETIVYFCPFRGGDKAYDFRRAEDRTQYVTLMRQFLAQDAHGVEVDYNDWPDKTSGTAIADVINLVCNGIAPNHPNAYVVYCPPIDEYRGMAKPSLSETLSNVPANVLTLWTGMGTLINTLRREDVEEWTKLTGRRPFLWVNRVFIRGQFSRELNKGQGDYVFRGEALPRDLNGLFEGVHFNAGLSTGYNRLPRTFSRDALVYLATAADFVWKPKAWKAEQSHTAAQRFVDIMTPLLGDRALIGEPLDMIPPDHPTWLVQSGAWHESDAQVIGEASGKVAVVLQREFAQENALHLCVDANVQTLELGGNMNGLVVFGFDPETKEYAMSGAMFASGHWAILRAQAGATVHHLLKKQAAEIPIEQPHRLRVEIHYTEGRLRLSEEVDGQWVARLTHTAEDLKALKPAAGLATKWGQTSFSGLMTR